MITLCGASRSEPKFPHWLLLFPPNAALRFGHTASIIFVGFGKGVGLHVDATVTVTVQDQRTQVQHGGQSLLLWFAREAVNLLWGGLRVCAQMSPSA